MTIPHRIPACAALLMPLLIQATVATAQLTEGQVDCSKGMNEKIDVVFLMQGKENGGCLKDAGAGSLSSSAQGCLTADPKMKVARAKSRLVDTATEICTAPLPPFGYNDPTLAGDAAQSQQVKLIADVFGSDLDSAILSCDSNKAGCSCQAQVTKALEKLVAAESKEFVSCKGDSIHEAASAAELSRCMDDPAKTGSVAADTNGKLLKTRGKLFSTITKSCAGPDVAFSVAFPGACSGSATAVDLSSCIETAADCRTCLAFNVADGLAVDCDVFDDGIDNESCTDL